MFDVIIVGGGSAGCVLASRLTENPERNVLLIEAGPDYPDTATLPPEIVTSMPGPALTHDWGYESQPGQIGRAIPLPRAKLMGGCSATNAAYALRGQPEDYDEWVALGISGWSFEEILPYFRKVETDHDFQDEWHGDAGLIGIRRDKVEELSPPHRAFLQACQNKGYALVDDHNRPGAVGVGLSPKNEIDGLRQSTAVTYLDAARQRENLIIRANSLVDQILLEDGRAAGVRLAASGEEITARCVILSGGSYSSPAILMRSGLGPAEHLADLSITLVSDLPGVGNNLSDHPIMPIRYRTNLASPVEPAPLLQVVLTAQSALGRYDFDLHIHPHKLYDGDADIGEDRAELRFVVGVMKPHSCGTVRLRSVDPFDAPLIDPGYYSHPDDMPRMQEAVRRVSEIVAVPPLSEWKPERVSPDASIISDEELDEAVRARTLTYHHPVGTSSMGPDSAVGAVVDANGKVHGVDNLYVVDASIMPTIPAANTNLPAMMVAERCSEWLSAKL